MPKASVDVLMWVSVIDYPSVQSFVSEARTLGVSMRMECPPRRLVLGRSTVFLVHDEAVRVRCPTCQGRGVPRRARLVARLVEKVKKRWRPAREPLDEESRKVTVAGRVEVRREVVSAAALAKLKDETFRRSARQLSWQVAPGQTLCDRCGGWGRVPDGRIFGCAVAEKLEMVFDCGAAAREYEDRKKRFGPKPKVPLTCVVGGFAEEKRRSGYRDMGGLYLVSTPECKGTERLAKRAGPGAQVIGPVVVFARPVASYKKKFSSTAIVSGARILAAARRAARE